MKRLFHLTFGSDPLESAGPWVSNGLTNIQPFVPSMGPLRSILAGDFRNHTASVAILLAPRSGGHGGRRRKVKEKKEKERGGHTGTINMGCRSGGAHMEMENLRKENFSLRGRLNRMEVATI